MEPTAWALKDALNRENLCTRLREPHIAPITDFVARLRSERGPAVPYVDPDTGGTKARILFVLKRPGPRAAETGFLSLSNPDQTARNSLEAFAKVGIAYEETMVWNIVPWYGPVSEKLSSEDLRAGANYLSELLRLLPNVRSVVFVGLESQAGMAHIVWPDRVRAFTSPHPSPLNINTNPDQREIMVARYREAWTYACGGEPDPAEDHAFHSNLREKVLEHIFLGELLRCLWRRGARDIEVLRAEVDRAGYDVVLECGGILRHIQLKASYRGASTATQKININLEAKPSGCVVWLRFDDRTMNLGPFLWFGGTPGERMPNLGDKIAKHTKANSQGIKTARQGIRVLPRSAFRELADMDALALELFGI